MRARCLTAGEAEFLALRGDELRHRLARGIESFRACVGTEPAGFVAPAWLFNAQLLPALARAGIAVTEDHQWVYEVTAGQRLRIPVITWATRTGLRRVGSRLLAPLLLRHWADLPVIRVAIHPADVDHPATVRSIEGVLASALTSRQLASYDEVRNFL
jgi:predicted deacetylase